MKVKNEILSNFMLATHLIQVFDFIDKTEAKIYANPAVAKTKSIVRKYAVI